MATGPFYSRPVSVSNPAKSPPIDARRRTAGKPYLPLVNTATPPVEQEIYLVYLNDGKYYGWMDKKPAESWLYTMYYPTAYKYKIRTKKIHSPYGSTTTTAESHKIVVDQMGATALIFAFFVLKTTDIVDPSNVKQMVDATIKGIEDHSDFDYYDVPDPFGLLKPIFTKAKQEYVSEKEPYLKAIAELRRKLEQDVAKIQQDIKDGPVENLRKKLINRLNSLSAAEDEKARGSEEAGLNLDF